MKSLVKKSAVLALFAVGSVVANAQLPEMQYFRPENKLGLNTFETTKVDTVPYTGQKLRIGAGFTQGFQALKSSNTLWSRPDNSASNKLVAMTPGFNYALANLDFNYQLADGVLLNLTLYLSARHHQETWVKSGYVQMDKVPFLNSDFIDNIMQYATVKVGHMEINYGDAHFRRSDNGNSIYNPFLENLIMDSFATEIAAEVNVQNNGLFGVIGVSNGLIHGDVIETINPITKEKVAKNPSIYGKIGYDKQLTDNFRLRLTQSAYYNGGTTSNTLFSGDRSGSHYWAVMETSTDFVANKNSGRWTPGFGHRVAAFQTNLFTKYNGLEFFGLAEFARGNALNASQRKVSQYAADLLYYFGEKENFYVGARYNTLRGELATYAMDANINRFAFAAGYFFTKNLLLKAEYVNQKYNNFPTYYSSTPFSTPPTTAELNKATPVSVAGGKFNGIIVEAVVGI